MLWCGIGFVLEAPAGAFLSGGIMNNVILNAVRQNPRILWDICRLPELNTRPVGIIERMAFSNIEREAFARAQFRRNSHQKRYYRHLSQLQRHLMRLENDYLINRPALRGMDLYEEMARVYNGLKRVNLSARQVKAELDLATEILCELESSRYVVSQLKVLIGGKHHDASDLS